MTPARIMHVDDEPELRELVRLSLEQDPGLAVRSCASGAEALAAIREWQPDLLLLGDAMPNMDAPRTLATLRLDRETAAIPVVLVTRRAQAHEISYFKTLGAAGVLPKPFEPGRLAEVVHRFLKPRTSGVGAAKEEFLDRAQEYASELTSCGRAICEGSDRADGFVQIRQIMRRLADAASALGYDRIVSGATALEEVIVAEGADADIRHAIATLMLEISSAVDDAAQSQHRHEEP